MAIIRYTCTEHGVHTAVDLERRALASTVDEAHRSVPMPSCCLLDLAHLALAEHEADLLGDHGPWHPERKRAVCHIEREG